MIGALKLLSNKPSPPVAAVPPVTVAPPVEPVKVVAETPVETPVPLVDVVESVPLPTPTPANDPFIGLVSGRAPDPTLEIPIENETLEVETIPEGEEEGPFRKLRFTDATSETRSRYIDVSSETGEVTIGNMDEEDFIDFWAVDAWEILSSAIGIFRIDISDIETEEHEIAQGRKAAKHLYRLAHKYPTMLGWMLSSATLNGGDVMIVLAFFGGKAAAVAGAYRDHKAEKKQQNSIEAQMPERMV